MIYIKTLKPCLIILLAVSALLISKTAAQSRNAIAIEWQDYYESSLSDDNLKKNKQNICLLCHIKPEGGEPWNAYGWTHKNKNAIENPEEAFKKVEQDNSDSDKNGQSNIFEISKGSQPGWNKHKDNWAYYKDGKKTLITTPEGIKYLD